MSAIGDYIHRYYNNYKEYGIYRTSGHGTAAEQQETALLAQNNLLKSLKERQDKQIPKMANGKNDFLKENIEKVLNAFLQGNLTVEGKAADEKILKEIKEKIEEDLKKNFSDIFNNSSQAYIDWRTLSIKGHSNKDSVGKVTGTFNEINEKKYLTIDKDSFEKKIIKLQENINKVIADSGKKEQQFQKDALEALKTLDNIKIQLEKTKQLKPRSSLVRGATSNNEIREIIKTTNELIEEYAKAKPIFLAEGELLEVLIKELFSRVSSFGINSFIDAVIEKTGDQHEITLNYYQKENFKKGLLNYISQQVKMTEKSSAQDKTDVAITWSDDKKIGLSAKNYNLKSTSNIHIVSQTPLLYLFQTMNKDFVNHWINIHAAQPKEPMNSKESKNLAALQRVPIKNKVGSKDNKINNSMDSFMAYLALSGETQSKRNKQVSNVFLINDKSTGKIRLFKISDLVDNFMDKRNSISIKIAGRGNLDDYVIESNKVNDEVSLDQRLANVLIELHQAKVSVSFSSSSLN